MKSLEILTGHDLGLDSLATCAALDARKPNNRSPAFAIQKLQEAFKTSNMPCTDYDFYYKMRSCTDKDYEGVVSWNDLNKCWQVGHGTHVPVAKIVQDTVRWYVRDWDFTRHTRDSDVIYPEDAELLPEEFKHLSEALMPLKMESTRRVFSLNNRFGYIDVYRADEEDLFLAEGGYFDDFRSHKRYGPPKNFWALEIETVLPLLKDLHVWSYKIQVNHMRRGV